MKAVDAHLREKALALRARGMALDAICERLSLKRTTVYGWIKDLPIPDTEKQSAARLRASKANAARAALLRDVAYQRGLAEAPVLLQEAAVRDFVVLYLAEGYRKNRNCVALGNSNPAIVLLASNMMRRFATNRVFYTLQYHADQAPQELTMWWAQMLGVEETLFSLQRKSNSGQLAGRNWRSEYGVLTVRSDDTLFRARLGGWMDFVVQSWHT